MKTKLTAVFFTTLVLAATGLAQTPPAPPAPPAPPVSPDRHEHDKMPKVPVTFLGVETSSVPRVVSEQLGLAKGFGLVVDYVVPNGPAAAGGVQANDILKLLNDQILTEPDQLSKLIRSFSEGTTVTLTVLRKGQEQKISVKLGKKEVPQRNGFHMPGDFKMGDFDLGEMRERLNDLGDELRGSGQNMMQDAVMKAHEEVSRARDEGMRAGERAREQAQRIREQAQRMREEAQRVRERSQRDNGQITITGTDGSGLRTTKIDMARAQIVFSDGKGELRIDNNDGKKILTAKDPQGRLLFSGPVESKEDLDKVPAEVRDRFNNLQQKDLPSVVSPEDKDDQDADEMDEDDGGQSSVEQVSTRPLFHGRWINQTLSV